MQAKEAMTLRSKIIGALLRNARNKAGKNQKDCAQALHCSTYMLSEYEHGRKDISLPELEVLAHLFRVPVTHFWDEKAAFEEEELPPPEMMTIRRKLIGVLLRKARLEVGMTQKECAQVLGCHPSRMSQYEYGERNIPFTQLEVLADILNVPITYFLQEPLFPSDQEERERADDLEKLDNLPSDLKDFVLQPMNVPYMRTAMKLSELPTETLREFAASLLDISQERGQ